MRTIYAKIKEIAKTKNLSVSEVEKRAEISARAIRRWDTYEPSVYKVAAVAKVLGVSIEEILNGNP